MNATSNEEATHGDTATQSVSPIGWARCPGCGVELPGGGAPAGPRKNASASCWTVYGELVGYESEHVVELGALHQMMVDAYASQHAGRTVLPIGPAFGLIGLCLAFEHGWTGIEVRDAHKWLADRYREWPDLARPATPATVTVEDVALAGSPEERAAAVRAWAAAVWGSWRAEHERVAALLDERLPADARVLLHRVT